MFILSQTQLSELAGETRKSFILETISDWFALFETRYERAPRLDFDTAWNIADHLLDQLEGLPQPMTGPVDYALIHAVLGAVEAGTSPEHLRSALATFCNALPADEAAFILFECICDAVVGQSNGEAAP